MTWGSRHWRPTGCPKIRPRTARLDRLAAEGVQFTNFWSQPVCSPTRATMLTGRYAFRTGVGRPGGEDDKKGHFPDAPERPESAPFEVPRRIGAGRIGDNWNLPPDEYTLPMAIKTEESLNYATAAIGKWHLSDNRNGWAEHPNKVGLRSFFRAHFWLAGILLRLEQTDRRRSSSVRPGTRRMNSQMTRLIGSRSRANDPGFSGMRSICRTRHCICPPKTCGRQITRIWTRRRR